MDLLPAGGGPGWLCGRLRCAVGPPAAQAPTAAALPAPALASRPGEPEPLALDERGKPLTLLQQCCVEQRAVGDDGEDAVVR